MEKLWNIYLILSNSCNQPKTCRKKTLNAYSIDLNQYFKYEKDILHPDICAFISFLHDELKLKDSSIRRKIITLKIFYEYLVNLDLIAITPFAKLKIQIQTGTALA